jgi:hypothetical protein
MRFIGIDPDVKKSGVAVATDGRLDQLHTMDFWSLIDFLDANADAHIVIEAGWLNKTASYHPSKNQSTAAKIGAYVGANWQIGKLLEEYCQYMNRVYSLVKPTRTKVDGRDFQLYTGWGKRTNSEERDAAMLIVGKIK